MNVVKCKSIVHSFLENVHFLAHQDNKQLIFKEKKYRIKPDETYIFSDELLVIEYEKNKRPVESISKYWWLLKKTNWSSHNVKLKCLILILQNPNDIREESIIILGEELCKLYPNKFEFKCVTSDQLSDDEIREALKSLI